MNLVLTKDQRADLIDELLCIIDMYEDNVQCGHYYTPEETIEITEKVSRLKTILTQLEEQS
jgi:phage-related holin